MDPKFELIELSLSDSSGPRVSRLQLVVGTCMYLDV